LVNQKVAVNQLRSLGYEPDVVANGKEALDLIQKIAYDLILMDCQTPIMDGYEATQAIRLLEKQHQIPTHVVIIAMTANAMQADRERCLAIGMDDYISKPVHKEVLAAKLTHWTESIYGTRGQVIQGDRYIQSNLPESYQLPESKAVHPLKEFASKTASASDLVDWNYLNQVCSDDRELAYQFLEMLVTSLPIHLATLEVAIRDQNYHTVAQEAHYIKGSGASVGVNIIHILAARLEEQAAKQLFHQAESIVAEIKLTLQQIETSICNEP
jgi:CheY-like chemotaxis protein